MDWGERVGTRQRFIQTKRKESPLPADTCGAEGERSETCGIWYFFFNCCDQIVHKKQMKGERLILGHPLSALPCTGLGSVGV